MQHVRRVAAAGRLRVGERLAADLFHAAACGTVLTLLGTPGDERDPALSPTAREAALAAITRAAPAVADPGPTGAAIALRAALGEAASLTPVERGLLAEWLEGLAATGS